jgi:hypothetical protein
MRRVLLGAVAVAGALMVLAAATVAWRINVDRGDPDRSGLEVSASLVEVDALPPINSGGGDCGWSVPLHDGGSLWVSCDGGGWSNMVAVAPAGSRAAPVFPLEPFVPVEDDLDCEGGEDDRVAWITGVASSPGADSTTVVALFTSGCREALLDGSMPSGSGGVARLEYRSEMAGQPLEPDAVTYDVWPDEWGDGTTNIPHVSGGVAWEDHVYVYACSGDFFINRTGPDDGRCTVARARLDSELGRRASWGYWDGETWVAPDCSGLCTLGEQEEAEAHQQPVDLPVPSEAVPIIGLKKSLVPEAFPVRWDPELELFIVANPQGPGNAADLWLRVAERPEGPWSLPAEVDLPCPDRADDSDDALDCRHHAPHPEVEADPGELVVSFYDSTTSPSSIRLATVRVEAGAQE